MPNEKKVENYNCIKMSNDANVENVEPAKARKGYLLTMSYIETSLNYCKLIKF